MLASVSHVGHRSARTTPRQFDCVDCSSGVLVQCKEGWPAVGTVSCAIVADKEKRFGQQRPSKSTTTQWSGVWYLSDVVPRVHVDGWQPRIRGFEAGEQLFAAVRLTASSHIAKIRSLRVSWNEWNMYGTRPRGDI